MGDAQAAWNGASQLLQRMACRWWRWSCDQIAFAGGRLGLPASAALVRSTKFMIIKRHGPVLFLAAASLNWASCSAKQSGLPYTVMRVIFDVSPQFHAEHRTAWHKRIAACADVRCRFRACGRQVQSKLACRGDFRMRRRAASVNPLVLQAQIMLQPIGSPRRIQPATSQTSLPDNRVVVAKRPCSRYRCAGRPLERCRQSPGRMRLLLSGDKARFSPKRCRRQKHTGGKRPPDSQNLAAMRW